MYDSQSVEGLKINNTSNGTGTGLKQNASPEKGLAWFVLFGSCFSFILIGALSSGLGIFYVEMQEDLGVSIVELSVIGSIRNGLFNLIVVFTSPLAAYIGCRRMSIIGALLTVLSYIICAYWKSIYVYYIFLGIITGLGNAMTIATCTIVLNNYFKERKTFAMATLSAAGSVGTLITGPFTSYLLEQYGLSGGLLISAGLALNLIVGGMIFLPAEEQNYQCNSDTTLTKQLLKALESYKTTSMWKQSNFYIFLLSSILHGFSAYILLQLLPNYMVNNNTSLDEAALSITAYGIATSSSRFIVGVIANMFPAVTMGIYILGGVVAAVFLYLIPGFHSATEFILAAAGYGMGYGCLIAMTNPVMVKIFGDENLPTCFGISLMVKGIGSLIGPPTVSAVAEVVSITGIEYILTGIVFLLSGLVMLPVFCRRQIYSIDEQTSLLPERK